MLCALVASAQADEPKRAVVVSTELGGWFPKRNQWRREYNAALENRLRSAQYAVVKADALTPAEAECRNEDCLSKIAADRSANVVVAGRVINDQQKLTSYHVRVQVFERGTEPASRTREEVCSNCTELHARDLLVTLMSAALDNRPEKVTLPPVDSQKPLEPVQNSHDTERPKGTEHGTKIGGQVPQREPASGLAGLTLRQRWLYFLVPAIGAGAIGAWGLAQGLIEKEHDGEQIDANGGTSCRPDCGYRRNTTKGQTAAFTVAGVSFAAALSLAVLGGVKWRPPKAGAAATVTPLVSTSTAGAQVEFSF
jgi:hypothetical protein